MKNLNIIFLISINLLNIINSYCQIYLSDPDTSYFTKSGDNLNLIIAADLGQIEHVNLLLSRGADINSTTYEGVTALMYASNNGDSAMLKFLLENGADPDKQPLNGISALIASARSNHFKIAEYLITHGADPDLKDINGVTALHYAAAYNFYELTDMLIFYGADAEIPDNEGNTPLISSCFNNCYEAADILLQNKVLINTCAKNGFTALMTAIQENNHDIIELLLSRGSEINKSNKAGVSPLSLAVRNGNYEIVNKLFQLGARSSKKADLKGIAKENKDKLMLEILTENDIKSYHFPRWNQLLTGSSINFNSTDFMNSFNLGILDSRLNTGLSCGFSFRPVANIIHEEFYNNIIYQYWERRYYAYLGAEKRFPLISLSDNIVTGPFLGLKGLFTYGNYRGSINKAAEEFILAPFLGWNLNYKFLILNFNYEYLIHEFPETRPGRYNFSILFTINIQRKKLLNNQISWLMNPEY